MRSVKFNSKRFALIFPFYPKTLESMIKKVKKAGAVEELFRVKKYIYQMLLAVDYMHRNRVKTTQKIEKI